MNWKGEIQMCTQSGAMTILEEVYTACQEIFPCKLSDAYLYGSYARGDYTNESDIDILLLVSAERNDIALKRPLLAAVTSDLSLKHNITVSVTVKPINHFIQFLSVLPFYQNILKEGIRYEL
jgi:predicted nucleotidyltransferase